MPQAPILLKALLRQNRWQQYAVFCAQYDQAARRIDHDLAGGFPGRAQLHRWLTGSVRSLPYPDRCRVLEETFPGWTAEQLFAPCPPGILSSTVLTVGGPGQDANVTQDSAAMPSVGIRPYLERAFDREHVSVDFAGFSGETLHGVIQEPLDKIRIGLAKPKSLTIRLLLPDTARPMVLPCRADDLQEDPAYRDRAHQITTRHARAILDTVQELADLGLIENATTHVRVHACTPLFKLYILNNEEAFFGFYPISRHTIPLPDGPQAVYDLMGKDALVFHHSAENGQSGDAPWIEQARNWFNTMWQTISYEPAE
jgi:hypothetical protein